VLAENKKGRYRIAPLKLSQLRQIDKNMRSTEILAGVLSIADRENKRKLLNDMLADQQLSY